MTSHFYIALLILATFTTPAYADWIDDWIQQKTESSPGYFAGQKRGYYTAGGFSARWYQGNDYLFTVEPPGVRYGCGGIDVNLGAFSLLQDSNYLMNKFERIIGPAVASYAFDIALDTLCPQCAKAMKSLESISDMLNQIQINDCQASQVLVAKLAGKEDDPKYRSAVDSWNAMTRGVEDSWHGVKEAWSANNDKPITNDLNAISGCTAEIKNVFGGFANKSVLQIAGERRGYPGPYMDLARGFVGDLVMEQINQGSGQISIIAKEIAPCPANKTMSTDGLVSGEVYARPSDGSNCYLVGDANRNLSGWAQQMLDQIANNIENNTQLTSAQESFIDAFPLPVYQTLKTAVQTNQAPVAKSLFADISARAYAFGMMSDLYQMVNSNVQLMETLIDRQSGFINDNCRIDHLIAPTKTALNGIKKQLAEKTMAIGHDYRRSIMELSTHLSVVAKLDDTRDQAGEDSVDIMNMSGQ